MIMAAQELKGVFRNFCFTYFNVDNPIDFNKDVVKYICYQKEICPDTGREHYQGYVELKKCMRANANTTKAIGIEGAHLEKRRGTQEEAIAYCMKTESAVPNTFFEYGTQAIPGERTDLKEAADILMKHGMKRVAEVMPQVYIKYHKGLEKIEKILKPSAEIEYLPFFRWQIEIIDIIEREPDDRTIYWVYDAVGGNGKTTFARHLSLRFGGIFLDGKGSDIKHGWNGEKLAIFNYPRSTEEQVSYGAIENVKDGIYFSGKYDSAMKRYAHPHVFVFANFLCPDGKFSQDRLYTITL